MLPSEYFKLRDTRQYDEMVEFHKFYYRRTGMFEWQVSPYKFAGFKLFPLFKSTKGTYFSETKEWNNLYISKYVVDNNRMSLPYNQLSIYPLSSAYTTIRATKGTYNCILFLYNMLNMLMMLIAIKYGTLDVQNKVGKGICGYAFSQLSSNSGYYYHSSIYQQSGSTDVITALDGCIATRNDMFSSIKSFGIENLWGQPMCVFSQVNNNKFLIFANDFSNYVDVGINMSAVSQLSVPNQVSFLQNTDYDWLIVPTGQRYGRTWLVGGSLTVDQTVLNNCIGVIPDTFHHAISGNNIGSHNQTSLNQGGGLFSVHITMTATHSMPQRFIKWI